MLGVRPARDRGNLWVRAGWAAGLAGALLVSACSTPAPNPAEPTDVAVPPPPPAACLLDVGVFTTSTGVGWQPDQSTASDARCVYDPVAAATATGDTAGASAPAGSSSVPDPAGFLAVEVTPVTAADPATELDSVAAVCADGSRAPLAAGSGFVCRFRGGSTFAALVRTGQLVTVSVSAVPAGTTAARLVVGLQQQLEALGR